MSAVASSEAASRGVCRRPGRSRSAWTARRAGATQPSQQMFWGPKVADHIEVQRHDVEAWSGPSSPGHGKTLSRG